MFRLLGFCIGSLASIAALLLLIGRPDFHVAPEDIDHMRFDAAVEKLKSKQLPPSREEEPVVADPDAEAPAPADGPDTEPVSVAAAPVDDRPPAAESAYPQSDVPDNEWHTFWTPFRTEIAARGFVNRLENVTGIDYRVVKADTGVYQVAFAYAGTEELESKLEQITAATGLDLSGPLP